MRAMVMDPMERACHVVCLVTLIVALVLFVMMHHQGMYSVVGLMCVELYVVVMRHEKAANRQRELEHLQDLQEQLMINQEQTAQFHRIDATTRGAIEGFNCCSVCSFENFKRTKFCSVCGESIVRHAGQDEKDVLVVPEPTHKLVMMLTKRQLRARKRKEWRRKVDVDGNVFWYRESDLTPASSSLISSSIPMAGWTVLFRQMSVPGEDRVRCSSDVNVQPSESGEPQHQWQQDLEQAQELEAQQEVVLEQDPTEIEIMDAQNVSDVMRSCRTKELSLIRSSVANAAQFPNGESLSAKRFEQVLQLASLDFPSRYSHFVARTSSSLRPAEIEVLKFSIHRTFVLEESMDQLSCVHHKHMHSIMRIHFMNENVVDAGGVHREWFMLLNEQLTSARVGLFCCTNTSDQCYYLNRNSLAENGEDHLVYYYAVGRLVGRALVEGSMLNFHFAVPLRKLMLGIPVTFDDLEYLDEDAYRGLVWLLENDNVDALGLTFCVNEVMNSSGPDAIVSRRVEIIDLVPNGREIDVTDANKREYVERKFKYLMFESVSRQLQVFLCGLYEIIPLDLLLLFDAEELDYILCGDEDLDVDEWEKHTRVSANLRGTSTLRWFWEVVREMPMEYRSRLLQFATGSCRVPASGFDGLTSYDGRLCPFTLKGKMDFMPKNDTHYIHGHACFNRIDLPLYNTKKELEKVLYAILDTELYGFTES